MRLKIATLFTGPNAAIAVELRVNDASAQQASAMSEASQRCRVRYVEDNFMNVDLMQAIIEKMPNADPVLAPNAELGIELANSELPDLVQSARANQRRSASVQPSLNR